MAEITYCGSEPCMEITADGERKGWWFGFHFVRGTGKVTCERCGYVTEGHPDESDAALDSSTKEK